MTTAQLSVGIKTDQAKADLLDLRREMANALKGMTFELPTQQLLADFKGVVSAAGPLMAASLTRSIDDAFKVRRVVNINQKSLTDQIRRAAQDGLKGLSLSVATSAAAPTPSLASGDIKAMVRGMIAEATDEIIKNAPKIRRAAREASGPAAEAEGPSTKPFKVSKRISTKVASSGYTFSATQQVPDSLVDFVEQGARAERKAKELQDNSARQIRLQQELKRRSLRALAQEEKRLAQELAAGMAVGPDNRTAQKLRDREAIASAREAVAEQKRLAKELAAAMAVGPDSSTAQKLRDREAISSARELAAEKRKLAREQRDLDKLAQQSSNEVFRTRRKQARDTAREQERETVNTVKFSAPQAETDLARLTSQLKQLRQAQAFVEQGRTDLAIARFGRAAVDQIGSIDNLQQRVNALRAANVRVKQSADDAAAALRKQMAAAYDAAKFQATGTGLSGRGVQVAGAKALVEGFGADTSRAFLGSKGFLVDEVQRLGSFANGAKSATEHTKYFKSAMNDAHSAARGLAGSLGAMWLTWGSTAPLVAAAALGMSLKSVFTVGKDVEYQLAFVAGLTGEAAIGIREFGQAMSGSMVPPKEAAEGLRALAQNGLNSVQALAALPDVMALATAGEMELADAALGATGILAAFNLGLSNLSHISDVFAKAAAVSNTSVAGMVEAMKQASTVAGQYGITVDETAASLAIMAQRNISGSAAGTALRNMISELAAPTKEAQRALKELGVDAFENGKIKEYSKLLEEVRNKTIGLNQETRVKFFEVIFNERGAKAADAILSDLDTYNRMLRQIRDESTGFTSSLTKILGDTTEGKVRKLTAEFQTLAAGALPEAKSQIDSVVMSLRNFVTDPSTQQGLTNLIKNVAAFTSALVDNAGLIVSLGASYALYKIALVGVAPVVRLLAAEKVAVAAATAAATTATVANTGANTGATGAMAAQTLASRVLTGALGAQALAARGLTAAVAGLGGAVGIATGGISILLGALAAWGIGLLATRDNTDAAAAAQDNLRESTIAATREIDGQIEALQRQARFQNEVRRLIDLGYTVEGAREAAGKQFGTTAEGQKAVAQLREQEALIERVRQAELNGQSSPEAGGPYLEAVKRAAELRTLIAREEKLAKDKQATNDRSRFEDQIKWIDAYNKKLGDTAAETKKFSLLDLRIQPEQGQLKSEDFNKLKASAEKALNDQLGSKTVPSTRAAAEASRANRQNQKDELADMEFRRRLVETGAKLEDAAFAERLSVLKAQREQKLVSEQEFSLREAALIREQSDARIAAIKLEQGEIQALLSANLKVPVDGLSDRLAKAKSPSDEIRSLLSDGTFKEAPDKLLRLLERLDELKVKAGEAQSKASAAAAAAASVGVAEMAELRKKFETMNVELVQRDLEQLIKLAQQADSLVIDSGRGPGASASEALYGNGFRERFTVPAGLKGEERAAAVERARILNEEESRRRFENDSLSRALKDSSTLGGTGAKDESLKARMDVFERYAPQLRAVALIEADYNRLLEDRLAVLAGLEGTSDGSVDPAFVEAARARVEDLRRLLAAQKEQADLLRARRDDTANKAGASASDNFTIQRSAAYGMQSFWKEYQKAATDSAKLTENVMSQAFSTVEQTLLKFAETGKLNLGQMFSSIAADALRMATSQGIKQLLGFGAEKLQKTLFPQGATKEAAEAGIGEAVKRVAKEGLGFGDTLSRMGTSIKEGTFLQDAWNLITQTTAPVQQQSMVSLTLAAQQAAVALQQVAASGGGSSGGGILDLFAKAFSGGGEGVDPGVGGDDLSLFFASAKGNVFGTTAFAKGSAFSSKGEMLNGPTMFQFAMGGAFRKGLAGEAGPEAVMPLRRTSTGHLGVMAQISGGGGAAPMQVNIHNYGKPEDVSVQERQQPDGSRVMDIFIKQAKEAVAADIASGGMVGRAVSQRTGTTPQFNRMGY